jgi:hypothetical protein
MEQEAQRMPLQLDIMQDRVIAREHYRGLHQGELTILRGQIEKRIVPLPAWAEEHLAARTSEELERLGPRFLDAPSLQELLK